MSRLTGSTDGPLNRVRSDRVQVILMEAGELGSTQAGRFYYPVHCDVLNGLISTRFGPQATFALMSHQKRCPVRAVPLSRKPQIWNRKSSALFLSSFALPPPDLTTKGFSTPAMIDGCWPWEQLRDRGPLRRLLPSFPPPTNSRRQAPCRPTSLGRARNGGHQSSSWFRGNIRFLARSNSTLCVGFLGSEVLGFSFLNYWSGGLGIVPFFFVGVFPCWSWGSNC